MKKIKVKRIIRDGIEMFWCPDCQDYRLREDMIQNKSKKFGVGGYCRKHGYSRRIESMRKNGRKKGKKDYKIDHRVSNEHKYYFKGPKRIKSVSVRPRTTGVCENWGKPRYERRNSI